MFAERPALVTRCTPVSIHGVPYVDVVLDVEGGTELTARLGPEAVPADLRAGDRVLAVSVMATVIELRRAPGGDVP